jgi:plastocyanin
MIGSTTAMRVGLAVVLSLLGVACGNGSTSPSKSPATETASAPAAGGATLEQGPGNALVFSPTKLTVTHGQTITVKNVGDRAHTFTISDQGIDVVNEAGQSQQVTINLAPGTYDFICRFHVASGMKGTLVVK